LKKSQESRAKTFFCLDSINTALAIAADTGLVANACAV